MLEATRLAEFVSGERGPYTAIPSDIEKVLAELATLRAQVQAGREAGLEEAAKICEFVRDNEFGKLPGHEHEPDFSTDDVCAEDVCAWHIRYVAALAQPAKTEGAEG